MRLQPKYIILLHLFLLAGCGIYRYSYDHKNQRINADKGHHIMAVQITEIETQKSVFFKAVGNGLISFSLLDFEGRHYLSNEHFSFAPKSTYKIRVYPKGDRALPDIIIFTDSLGNPYK